MESLDETLRNDEKKTINAYFKLFFFKYIYIYICMYVCMYDKINKIG